MAIKEKFTEYKNLNLQEIASQVLQWWKENDIYEKSIEERKDAKDFVFYEGPPSANGMPGIHHVLGRTIKDIFCRFKTQSGFKVERKSGWDTHGLPVELQVEKRLGIKKEDIGKTISIADYNKACKEDVLKFKTVWEDVTEKYGYWLDLKNPYITYDSKYIETIWYLLKELFNKELLYQGYTIQPYSPAAGTGLSSHELNQPGTYKNVKDLSCVALFQSSHDDGLYFAAWTTTPWTLPANTALAVGKNIVYVEIETINPFSHQVQRIILAQEAITRFFKADNLDADFTEYKNDGKNIPYRIVKKYIGADLEGIIFNQLLPYIQPVGDAFRIIIGDFVTTEDGTGIVHIAPTFGADDMRVANQNNIPSILVDDPDKPNQKIPIVDKTGKFVKEMGEFAGRYVKDFFPTHQEFQDVNVDIVVKLKKEGFCLKSEKYEHNYPHCWRTDKPILYYPLQSWFIRTTAFKDRLIELNNTINWKPESTGTGRFGNWLENLVDWNLSRSRYWGTPLPLWICQEEGEIKCIGSIQELREEAQKAVELGFLKENPILENFDPHRPYVDDVVLVSSTNKPMYRVQDVVDVWFDSGAMPYAQLHYPFENNDVFKNRFPADFIAEGVDQTRGWFFTLHTIATILFDSVAFKTVISNGLVLDKNGVKMSKRLGNIEDPFELLELFGADATRWYLVSNAAPWENLKFNREGIDEIRKKLFGTLYNVYSFFALYANIDEFCYEEPRIEVHNKPEIDIWIISELNTLVEKCKEAYEAYEPTRAARAIQEFVDENLSNWYVRLSRRRFWKGEYAENKISAYQTLHDCLFTLSKLMAPIAPFFAERLYQDLNKVTHKDASFSVHLSNFPSLNANEVFPKLQNQMYLAQTFSSLVLSLRRKSNIRVRQPLQKILIPSLNSEFKEEVSAVEDLILSEVNVKEIEFIDADNNLIKKKIKLDFKKLGPKYGKSMKELQNLSNLMTTNDINTLEKDGTIILKGSEDFTIAIDEVEIMSEDIPGWLVASRNGLTVALDITITEELRNEGLARELVNRIQNLRKESDFEVTDRISVEIKGNQEFNNQILHYIDFVKAEVLATEILIKEEIEDKEHAKLIDLEDGIEREIILKVLE